MNIKPDKAPVPEIRRSPVRNTVEIIFVYLVIGILWIFLSDRILSIIIEDNNLVQDLQLAKGIFYVVVTGYLFYIIIKKRMDLYLDLIIDLEDTVKKLKDSNTSLRSLEEKLYNLAYYDELTGLLSKNMIIEKVSEHINETPHDLLGFIYLDIDDFKNVNEIKGHHIGDELIKLISDELKIIAGPPHYIGRLSGDEFVILFKHALSKDMMLEAIRNNASRMAKTFMLDEDNYYVSVSAGVSFYPEDAKNYQNLLQCADMALNIAKQKGKNQIVLYQKSFVSDLEKYTDISNHLYQAVNEKQFQVYFQPIVSSVDYKAKSVEALIRWIHPTKGVISPMTFIPIAEKTGHIKAITWFVIEQSFKQYIKWKESGIDVEVSINLSAVVLNQPEFIERLKNAIKKYKADPSKCIFEITESAVLEHIDESIITLQNLRTLGFKIALDDFGSGYSSLTYLQKLPIDILKIDRSFIKTITEENPNAPLLKFMIDLAHQLNLKVVSEGIETNKQKETLTILNSDYQQGYYFSRPNLPDQLDIKLFK